MQCDVMIMQCDVMIVQWDVMISCNSGQAQHLPCQRVGTGRTKPPCLPFWPLTFQGLHKQLMSDSQSCSSSLLAILEVLDSLD